MERSERLKWIVRNYYSRRDVQAILAEQARSRETVPLYFDIFGKRPDTIEYSQDIENLALRGATSFHVSEEIWSNPLEVNTNLKEDQLNKLRVGWDLILDIDCNFIEYSKVTAWLLCEALYFHGIKNLGLKFSGRSGFHIGVSFKAFPPVVNNIKTKDYFPQGPRLIAAYLKEMIAKDLGSRLLEMSSLKEISDSTGKPQEDLLDKDKNFNPFSLVDIDTILIAPRHLYRMAYSLHEKSGLASIVIKPEQLKAFHPAWAKPDRVFVKPFIPVPEPGEAKELLIQALDWNSKKEERKSDEERMKEKTKDIDNERNFSEVKISVEDRSKLEEFYPPAIKAMLEGMKQDGRKRALFVLINFFKSLDFSNEEIEKIINEWNEKNYKPLKENYIATQLGWFRRQKKMLPPNFNNQHYYSEIGITIDDFSLRMKNPINYVKKRLRMLHSEHGEKKYYGRKKTGKYGKKGQ